MMLPAAPAASRAARPFLMLAISTLAVLLAGCSTLVVQPRNMVMGLDKTVGEAIVPGPSRTVLITLTEPVHNRLTQGGSVKPEDRLPPLYARFVARLHRDYGLSRIADWPLDALSVRCLVFSADKVVDPALLAELRQLPLVETVQAMQYFEVSAASAGSSSAAPASSARAISPQDTRLGTPKRLPAAARTATHSYNDPYFELQGGMTSMQVHTSHAWSTGKGVVVAVVDTGLDAQHPDLDGRVVGIRNFVDRNYSLFNKDIHGTAVAGVIAANANNGEGIVGVAPDAWVLGLKACAQVTDSSFQATCTTFTLAKALNFAINESVDVINLSLAGPQDALLSRLIQRAVAAGTIVVGARGATTAHAFPSTTPGVIAVASDTAANPKMPAYTSAGTGTLLAPGHQVVTTVPGDAYDFFTGNSFATAHVSGVDALLRQRKPHMTPQHIRSVLQTAADAGTGVANACQALRSLIGAGVCTEAVLTSVSAGPSG